MREREEKRKEDRRLTIWVMRDRSAAYTQYQVNPGRLKRLAVAVGVGVILLPVMAFLAGWWSSREVEERAFRAMAEKLVAMEGERIEAALRREEVETLAARVNGLETRLRRGAQESRQTVKTLEEYLNQWTPQGAAGGELESVDSFLPAETNRAEESQERDLSLSDRGRLNELKARLDYLERQFEAHERSVNELAALWGEGGVIFSAFPRSWPVREGKISSLFGMRVHPVSRKFQFHSGIDIDTEPGTRIYPAATGVVIFAGEKNGYGLSVIVDHGYGVTTLYAHCRQLLVGEGESVELDQAIAEVGNSGVSTGPHLHFEIRIDGIPVDPMHYLLAVPFSSL